MIEETVNVQELIQVPHFCAHWIPSLDCKFPPVLKRWKINMNSNGTDPNNWAVNSTTNCRDDDCHEYNGMRPSSERSPAPPEGWVIFASIIIMVSVAALVVFFFLRRLTNREHLMMRNIVVPAAAAVVVPLKEKIPTEAELKQRYEAIERGLINKTVMAHDDACASLSHTERGEEFQGDTECPICYDPLGVGDVVSFSRGDACRHVFHHKCLKAWLIENKDCPVCRTELLPWKAPKGAGVDKKGAGRGCFYCVEHQIVSLDDRELPSDMEEILLERGKVVPDASVLVATRSKFESV